MAIAAVAVWALALGAWLDLTDQEAYYWLWSRVPDWCYFEHPPLQAWLIRASTWVLGDSSFAVRLPTLLCGLLALFLFRLWVEERFGARSARVATVILCATFFYPAGLLIALPDGVLAPFAVAVMLFAERRRPIETGIALGLAALAKWTALMLVPGVIAAFLVPPLARSWEDPDGVFEKRPWLSIGVAGAIALLFQAPVLYWNATHEWASFVFHLAARHGGGWPSFPKLASNAIVFVASQCLMGGFGLLIAPKLRPFDAPRSRELGRPSLLWWILPAFLVFGFSALKGELRFYWTSAAFFAVVAQLASSISAERERIFVHRLMPFVFVTPLLVTVVLALPVGAYLRPFTDNHKAYDLRHSPRGDLLGWRDWVKEDLEPAGLLAPDVRYVASDFRLAAQLAWAARFEDVSRLSTFGPQYQFRFWPAPDAARFGRVVFFGDNRRGLDVAGVQNRCAHPLVWRSKEVRLVGEIVKLIPWAVCEAPRI
jgi:dolichol-phosphate mannosyltransferase